jgi:SpoIIAA-like
MEERIRFITHKGKEVLLVDISHCTTVELADIARLVPTQTAIKPRGSVLLLADFTGTQFDKSSIETLKQATVFARPHLKRSAWVGVESLPKVFYENIKAFSQRDLPTFKTREEALEWLISDEQPIAAGK